MGTTSSRVYMQEWETQIAQQGGATGAGPVGAGHVGAGVAGGGTARDAENYAVMILDSIDPYKVLGIGKNFTMEELTAAFRKAALVAHPDRGGNSQLFNIVKDCFRKLSKELNARNSDKPHYELKKAYDQSQQRDSWGSGGAGNMKGDTNAWGYKERPEMAGIDDAIGPFNSKFNKIFDQNRLPDEENDNGYGDMMAPSSGTREEINVTKTLNTFNKKTFNNAFDATTLPTSKEVLIYKEPEPMNMSTGLKFTELGTTNRGDFSKDEAERPGGLIYTDFKKAYSTTRLVDPRSVAARKEYRNVEEYERDLAAATEKKLTREERLYLEKKKGEEERREQDRLRRLAEKDSLIEKQYDRMTQGLIKGRR